MQVKEFWSKVTHVNPGIISRFQQPCIVSNQAIQKCFVCHCTSGARDKSNVVKVAGPKGRRFESS